MFNWILYSVLFVAFHVRQKKAEYMDQWSIYCIHWCTVANNHAFYFVISSTEKKIVPNFLIEDNDNIIDISNLLKGLKLVSDFLEKSILKPNNINYPASRMHFVNLLK